MDAHDISERAIGENETGKNEIRRKGFEDLEALLRVGTIIPPQRPHQHASVSLVDTLGRRRMETQSLPKGPDCFIEALARATDLHGGQKAPLLKMMCSAEMPLPQNDNMLPEPTAQPFVCLLSW